MPRTARHGGAGRTSAAATHNDELIGRAARRAGWARTALERAAGDLHGARDTEGKAMTGVAEIVSDEAARVSRLAADIESHRQSDGAVPDCIAGLVEGGA